MMRSLCLAVWFVCLLPALSLAQEAATAPPQTDAQRIRALEERLTTMEQTLAKSIDDLMWFQRLSDIAVVDKVKYTGPPPRVVPNPTGQGATNPVIISAYTFLPKKFVTTKLPLLVFVHDGIHSDFKTASVHIVRELVEQGYAVVASDYRGSTGYGRGFWQLIDYGGLENDDVYAGMKWMLENHANIDPQRVGILGWSHGGMITLMNLFDHPQDYKVGYAGVPVSDLIARMGYKNQNYRELFSAPYHLGKSADQNVNEYKKRSPAWNAEKLQTPLLIHTNTNDEDVNVLEVEHLIKSLKAAGKKFEYKIYDNAPGGHSFNRLDTKLAKESRAEIYRFLASYLTPPNPVK
ncbi:MAG TPA: prolyl oligopeptidase family serine peptidase [Blastocatellia bacterium]|nr:prolyl oligopeptidase family serine peptidase [Blastocatellia bacterium]